MVSMAPRRTARTAVLYARITPETKARVKAWAKHNGDVAEAIAVEELLTRQLDAEDQHRGKKKKGESQ